MYQSPHELWNDLILWILGNEEILKKSLKCLELMTRTQPTTQKANFDSWARKLRKTSGKTLCYFCELVYNILFIIVHDCSFCSFVTRPRPHGVYILAFQKFHSLLKPIFRTTKLQQRLKFNIFKWATKLLPKIIFVSATKIGENTTNILNYFFSK